MSTPEPEITDAAGIQRKAHYGSGRQPWDDIVEAGWAPAFAAGNVLKYVRRAAAKNGEDDIAKAKWYLMRLIARGKDGEQESVNAVARLAMLLTPDEWMALVGVWGSP